MITYFLTTNGELQISEKVNQNVAVYMNKKINACTVIQFGHACRTKTLLNSTKSFQAPVERPLYSIFSVTMFFWLNSYVF